MAERSAAPPEPRPPASPAADIAEVGGTRRGSGTKRPGQEATGAAIAQDQTPPGAAPSPWRFAVVAVLFVTVVTGFFDRISVAVLFTNADFNHALGTDFRPAMLGLLMTSFLLAYALSSLFLSVVGDLLGPRRALAGVTAVWGVMMAAIGSCSSFAMMLACRAALGAAEGPQFSIVSKTVQRWFPPRELARANSAWMIGSPLGSAIGFPLTIWLTSHFGWRTSFYVFGALSLCVVLPLVLAVVRDAPPGPPLPASATARPRLSDAPILLHDWRVWLLSLHGCGVLTYLWGLNSWLPTYLERERHFDLNQMGLYSSLPFVMMFAGEIVSGLVSDRIGRRAPPCIVGLLCAGLLLYVATIVPDAHIAAVIIALSAGAWGFGLPTHYALSMQVLPPRMTATGIGLINGIGNLVGALAPTLIGAVVSFTGSFQSGLLVIVFASVAGALVLMPMWRRY